MKGLIHRASQTGQYKDDLAKYIEVDFPEVTTKKAMSIRKSKEMNALLGDPSQVQVGKLASASKSLTRLH